jgi:hypothetical protein
MFITESFIEHPEFAKEILLLLVANLLFSRALSKILKFK